MKKGLEEIKKELRAANMIGHGVCLPLHCEIEKALEAAYTQAVKDCMEALEKDEPVNIMNRAYREHLVQALKKLME